MKAKGHISGVTPLDCMTVTTPTQKCTDTVKHGTAALLALLVAFTLGTGVLADGTLDPDSGESEGEQYVVSITPDTETDNLEDGTAPGDDNLVTALIDDTPVLYVDGAVSLMSAQATSGYDFITSAQSIFAGVIKNVDRQRLLERKFNGVHYVAWRDSSSYYLAYSPDLDFNDSRRVFTAPTVTLISYTYTYNSSRNYTVQTDSNFSLTAGNTVVCSDLGAYPSLDDGRNIYEQATTVAFCLCAGLYIITTLFRSICRRPA